MTSTLRAVLACAVAFAAGCFNTTNPPCTYRCGPASACPDDYECRSDGYCHLKGSTAACGFNVVDGAATDGAPMDAALDAPAGDLVTAADMAMTSDAADDFAATPDLAPAPDLVVPADLAPAPDLVVPADLLVVPDLACVAASCTSPPANSCTGNVRNVYPNPGSCDTNGACVYTPSTMTCPNGCFQGSCTSSPGTAITKTTAAQSGGNVVLVTTSSNGSSTGGGPAATGAPVTAIVTTQPGGNTQRVELIWTTVPDFSSGTSTVTLSSTAVTASSETWQGQIPAQPSGTEVYFYIHAVPYSGSDAYAPNGFGVHYAYAVQ